MTFLQQDKKEKDLDGKRRKTSQSEDVSISDSRASQMLILWLVLEQSSQPEPAN